MIGNILLPVVAKILPYLNAFVIVLQRLFTWLAKVLGIDLSSLMAKNETPDNSALSDMLDEAEGLETALDNDADKAKKLKKQLQGFDALNNLTSKDDSTTGALDGLGNLSGLLDDAFNQAVKDYLEAWDEAFKKLENDAQKLADKIQAFFLRLLKPVIKAWEKAGQFVVNSWKRAIFAIQGLFKVMARDFWKVWEQEDTTKIFENIFIVIGNIGLVVRELAKNFKVAWMSNNTGLKIFEDIRDIVLIITEHIKSMSDATVEWAKKLDFRPMLSKFEEWLSTLKPFVDNLMGTIEDFYNKVMLPLGKWTLEQGLPKLLQVFIDFNNKVDWESIRTRLRELWEHLEPFAERVGEGIILFVEDISNALADFLNSDKFTEFLDKLIKWMDGTSARDVANTLEAVAKAIIALKVALLGFQALTAITTTLTTIKNFLGLFGAGGALAGASANIESTATALTGLTSALLGLGYVGEIKTGIENFTKSKATSELLSKDVREGKKSADEFVTSIDKALSKMANLELNEYAKVLKQAYEDGKLSADAYYQSMEKIQEYAHRNKDSYNWLTSPVSNKNLYDIDYYYKQAEFAFSQVGQKAGETFTENFKSTTQGGEDVTAKIANDIDTTSGQLTNSGAKAGENVLKGFNAGIAPVLDSASKSGSEISNRIASPTNLANINNAGKNTALSFGNGIKSSESNVFATASGIGLQVASKFTNNSAQANAMRAGSNLMIGFGNGMSSSFPSVLARSANFATNIVKVFTSVWKIHSPSRVMDEMGVYFMQGLQNGIESMYSPIENSVNKFGGELAKAPDFNEKLGFDGATANVSSSATTTYNADNSETNSLLRQQNSLLQAILEKDMGISEGALFKSVQNSATSYYKMTGNKAFA